jgi:penicillin-binding protein 1A
MSDDGNTTPPPNPPLPFPGPARGGNGGPPRVNRLRLGLVLAGLALLALVSTVFGMMMAVASDLPALENREEYKHSRNSVLYDIRGRELGVLTGNQNRILVPADQISPAMKHAIIAIEDKRFYEHPGVDVRGIGRAFFQDILSRGSVQGGSTITQQFVKNALQAQEQRTLFQKLREAALAYHLSHKWSKQKILTEYLNSVYFGNGAYGVESAARVYFGSTNGCGTSHTACAATLTPAQAALIAGVVSSPSAWDPIAHPVAAKRRRDHVIDNMLDQGYLTPAEAEQAREDALPAAPDITPPQEKSVAPYFTSWVKQQVVDRFGAQRAFGGGLKIRTTIDLDIQQAAEQAVRSRFSNPDGPTAAVVVLDNKSGEVRAMVGGNDYNRRPFNLATQGQRQPGSSFKAFVLAAALRSGISPGSVWASHQKKFVVPNSGGKEFFVVNNYEGNYSGAISLSSATAVSDNSVFAEVGIKVGIPKVARLAREMGIRTPVSTNPAITLGGLKHGVTVLDMAHAYETIAERGDLISGSLGAGSNGPVGVHEVRVGSGRGRLVARNQVRKKRVLPPGVADTETNILRLVVTAGTGKAAQVGDFAAGKTGTTENYGDAWFVGFTKKYTVAVWVGYPDRLKSMETDYNGGPVAGGTYPAEIWHDVVANTMQIDAQREAERATQDAADNPQPVAPAPTTTDQTATDETQQDQDGADQQQGQSQQGGAQEQPPQTTPAPSQPPPTPQPTPTPTPAPPSGGTGPGAGGTRAPPAGAGATG